MEKIVIQKDNTKKRPKRTSVVVSPETYVKVYELAHETGWTVEAVVELLLSEALKCVEVQDSE